MLREKPQIILNESSAQVSININKSFENDDQMLKVIKEMRELIEYAYPEDEEIEGKI